MEFELIDDTAMLRFDDGKVNAIGHDFIDAINEGLDRAESEAKAVIILGRKDRFSAGFDLDEFKKGAQATQKLLKRGTEMFLRLYSHGQPIIAGCTGHAIAAGAFILLAADTRIGTTGNYKLGLNETAIGSPFPVFGHELAGSRLSKRHLTAALVQSKMYDPAGAVDAGFLDEVVAAADLESRCLAIASDLAALPAKTYAINKRDSRADSIQKIQSSLA
jgi:enoyl-CoA hydratase